MNNKRNGKRTEGGDERSLGIREGNCVEEKDPPAVLSKTSLLEFFEEHLAYLDKRGLMEVASNVSSLANGWSCPFAFVEPRHEISDTPGFQENSRIFRMIGEILVEMTRRTLEHLGTELAFELEDEEEPDIDTSRLDKYLTQMKPQELSKGIMDMIDECAIDFYNGYISTDY